MNAHLSSVKIKEGVPTTEVQLTNTAGQFYDNGNANGTKFLLTADIDTLKHLILELTKALHAAEMIREHCASCEKCSLDALGAQAKS